MSTKLGSYVGNDILAMEIGNRTRWASGTMTGGPIGEISDMNFGMLPDGFRDRIRDARYAIYSYETPIVVELANGRWVVPDVKYSPTTSRQLGKIIGSKGQPGALELAGIEWEKIPETED